MAVRRVLAGNSRWHSSCPPFLTKSPCCWATHAHTRFPSPRLRSVVNARIAAPRNPTTTRWRLASGAFCFGSDAGNSGDDPGNDDPPQQVYLHVGPSGDCWTGSSLFAAKHLQPDYVKSLALPPHLTEEQRERLVDRLQDRPDVAQQMYDTGVLPPDLLGTLLMDIDDDDDDDDDDW